ncbi:MAG: response regulator [Blastocatellia bacterium]
MTSILFVDDDANILQGLRRLLHNMRHQWEMSFVQSGKEALTLLSEKSVHVVIADLQMPGMNGTQLLETVRLRYPHIVRLALSGYPSQELTQRSLAITHWHLAKPCDAENLKLTISKACSLATV